MRTSSAAGLLVAAPPTLLRHGLLLTPRELWPEHPASLTTTAPQLLEQLQQQSFALLIIDSTAFATPVLPTLVQQVRRQQAQLPLLVLTGRRPPVLPLAGPAPLRLLPHHAAPTEVARAAAELLQALPAPVPTLPPPLAPAAFSPRELEVLALVLADLSNEEIANQLCVSIRTVESHRRSLLQKAGVRTPIGLAVRALREGWVGPPTRKSAGLPR